MVVLLLARTAALQVLVAGVAVAAEEAVAVRSTKVRQRDVQPGFGLGMRVGRKEALSTVRVLATMGDSP